MSRVPSRQIGSAISGTKRTILRPRPFLPRDMSQQEIKRKIRDAKVKKLLTPKALYKSKKKKKTTTAGVWSKGRWFNTRQV